MKKIKSKFGLMALLVACMLTACSEGNDESMADMQMNNAKADVQSAVFEGEWTIDKEVVDTFVLKTIKRFDPSNGRKQELLPEYNDDEDREFACKLFRASILNADQYQQYMSDASRNWDFSRLAYMDVVIMQIAIAEMMTFPNIPISVTINEYVDLAKLYSTMKSGGYINGMLDTIARYLVETGKLLKPIGEPRGKRI